MNVQVPITLPFWRCTSGHIHRNDEPYSEEQHLSSDPDNGSVGPIVGGLLVSEDVAAALADVNVTWRFKDGS